MPLNTVVTNTVKAHLDAGVDPNGHRYLLEKLVNQGSSDMAVDGSSTPVEFSVTTDATLHKSIDRIRLILHGDKLNITSKEGQDFGKGHSDGLDNGITFKFTHDGEDVPLFLDPVYKLSDFYLYADEIQYDKDAVDSGVDLLLIEINFPECIVISAGSNGALTLTVSDDLTDLDRFECIVRGRAEVVLL